MSCWHAFVPDPTAPCERDDGGESRQLPNSPKPHGAAAADHSVQSAISLVICGVIQRAYRWSPRLDRHTARTARKSESGDDEIVYPAPKCPALPGSSRETQKKAAG